MKTMKSFLIRPTFRGLVLALAVTTLASYVAHAVPYASQVTRSGNTVTFILNQEAQGMVVLRDGANPVTFTAPVAAGQKTFDMTGYTTYSIIVTGNTAKAWTQFIPDGGNSARNFWFPNSVAINKNPASTNFGKVYINNGNLATPGTTGAGRVTPDGIYVLRADGEAISGPHTGGQQTTSDGGNYSRFYKINLNPDDDCLYASSYYDDLAFGFNEDLSVCTQLIDASNKTNIVQNPTNDSDQYVESVYATGSRAAGNLMLYTVNSSYYDTARKGIIAYSLGANLTATPGDIGTQAVGPDVYKTSPNVYYPSDVDRDSKGNWYTSCYRASANQAPDVMKFDGSLPWPINTVVWNSVGKHDYMRGIGVNEAGGTVAVGRWVGGSGQVYFYDLDTGADRGMLDIGNVARDVAFDVAGNMVSVDNSTEFTRFWSPGGYSVATTKSDGTFQLVKWDDLSVVSTADPSAAEAGPDPAIFTITRSGGPTNALQVYYTLSGTAVSNVDYTVSPQSPFTFPEGQTSIDITITPIDDGQGEPIETVVLTLATGIYNIVSPASAEATIADNDLSLRYWDINGATAGAGSDSPVGTWGTNPYWSTSDNGDAATGAWTDWAGAVFSAGNDAFGTFTVTVSGTQKVGSLSFEDGFVTLDGGSLTLTNFEGIKVFSQAWINSVLGGASGLTMDGPGNLILRGANNYTGPTRINGGSLMVGAEGCIPDNSAVIVGATGVLNLLDDTWTGHNETIGSLAGAAGAQAYVPMSYTLTFGGDNTDTLWDGTTTGGGLLTKVGTGIINIGDAGVIAEPLTIAGGTVQINAAGDLGAAGIGNPITIENGATLESTSAGIGANFYPTDRPVTVGTGGGTLKASDSGAILFVQGASSVISGGTLIYDGPGETRTYNVEHTFAKLIVKGGLYTAGQSVNPGYATSFGAIPAAPTADAITLQTGGQIRKAGGQNVFLDPFQGITLGSGGGTIRAYGGNVGAGTFGIPGTISGSGPLTLNAAVDAGFGPIIVLGGNNTYSGGTTLAAGVVYVTNSAAGSGTGSGSVTVNGATLGGDGAMGGPVVFNGGNLSPGYSFNLGPLPVTPVTKDIARLVLTNGLNLSAGGVNTWQLGALSVANPGTDFDQVAVTGGNVTLGGTSTLAIGFTGTATAPNESEPFWQEPRQWKVIALSGGGSVSGNFSAITGTAGITNGTFSTMVDATGVTLVYSLGSAPSAVTNMTISTGPAAGQLTIGYSGGGGSQFVLCRSFNIAQTPITTWDRVATNATSPGSFAITIGADPKAFYYIKAE